MSHIVNIELENTYKQFQLTNLPIFQNFQQISINKLFKILTITELEELPVIEALNFYLYCHFFKNRLLYSAVFRKNLAYINLKSVELKQRIKTALDKYDKMLQETKSESDLAWIEDNILVLNEGLIALDTVQSRCDYYDKEITQYLHQNKTVATNISLAKIEVECAVEFTRLSELFVEIGRIIGRE